MSLIDRRRAMTADIEQCCQFTVYSSLVENVGTAGGILLVTAGFRHSALLHDLTTILAAILKFGSVTRRIQITHFMEKSMTHQILFTAC
jgi:hypothetical protein